MTIKFSPCSPCCCPTIGFGLDYTSASWLGCCSGGTFKLIQNLANYTGSSDPVEEYDLDFYPNWNQITQCKMAYFGASPGTCNENNWACPMALAPQVLTYIQNGGRVFIAGDFDEGPTAGCITQAETAVLNNFLVALGSSMTIGYYGNCCNWGSLNGGYFTGNLNVDVPMLSGVNSISLWGTTIVQGGTWLAKTVPESLDSQGFGCTSPQIFLAMEKIGDGYLIASGDAHVGGCSFWNNFISNPDDKML